MATTYWPLNFFRTVLYDLKKTSGRHKRHNAILSDVLAFSTILYMQLNDKKYSKAKYVKLKRVF